MTDEERLRIWLESEETEKTNRYRKKQFNICLSIGCIILCITVLGLHLLSRAHNESAILQVPESYEMFSKAVEYGEQMKAQEPRMFEDEEDDFVLGGTVDKVSSGILPAYETIYNFCDDYGYQNLLNEEERAFYHKIDGAVKMLWNYTIYTKGNLAGKLPTGLTTKTDAKRVLDIYMTDHPEAFFVVGTINSVDDYDEVVLELRYRFDDSDEVFRRSKYWNEFQEIAAKCLELTQSMEVESDYAKVKVIYDWMCSELPYFLIDEGIGNVLDDVPEYAAAKLFKMAMNVIRIPCVYMQNDVNRDTTNGWNYIKLGEEGVYGVDLYSEMYNEEGRYKNQWPAYEFFLKGTKIFSKENDYAESFYYTGYFAPDDISEEDYLIEE